MTLYILGNGFDLAHELPTAYWDFRTYLKSAHPEFLEAFEEHYDIYPSMSDEAKKEYLWNRFESNLATTVDIGRERGNNSYNMVQGMEAPFATQYMQLFDTLWNDQNKMQDVTDIVIENISNACLIPVDIGWYPVKPVLQLSVSGPTGEVWG